MASQDPEDLPEPPQLRFLRLLVTVLTGVMIAGMVLMMVGVVAVVAGGGTAAG